MAIGVLKSVSFENKKQTVLDLKLVYKKVKNIKKFVVNNPHFAHVVETIFK